MRKIRLLIYDAQFDPIPKKMWKHPAILSDSKRRGRHPSKILLYTPIHYTAMKQYNISIDKYGRPDITHRILLNVLDHPLNRMKLLEIYVKNRRGELIWINPEVRLPLDYYRFEGLIIQLFRKRMIPPDDGSLLKIVEDLDIDELIGKRPIILTKDGEPLNKFNIDRLFNRTVILGGFQRGEYPKRILDLDGDFISIYKESILASTAISIFLSYLYFNINL